MFERKPKQPTPEQAGEARYRAALNAAAKRDRMTPENYELRIVDEAARFARDLTYHVGRQPSEFFAPVGYTNKQHDMIQKTADMLWNQPQSVAMLPFRRNQLTPENPALLDMASTFSHQFSPQPYTIQTRWDIGDIRPLRILLKHQSARLTAEDPRVDWLLLPTTYAIDPDSLSQSLGIYRLPGCAAQINMAAQYPTLDISYPAKDTTSVNKYVGITTYKDPATNRHYTLFAAPV